jgi:bacterioferritin-associated ferredoxin
VKVAERELPGQPIEALVATDTDGCAGTHDGEVVGYRCECGACDETLMQIIHDPDCELAGEYGRDHYDVGARPIAADRPWPELSRDHRIDIIEAAWTDRTDDVHNGESLAFRCGECGNSDETLVEIRHDEDCSLAGRFGPMAAPGRAARTDGGE